MSREQINQQIPDEEEDAEEQWEVLRDHPDYEICREYPHQIRKIETHRILKESISNRYLVVSLNGRQYKKHRLVALQWIDNPDNLPYVDHINKVRNDNRIENLRWVTHLQNMNNKGNYRDHEIVYIDKLPDDSILVDYYGGWNFEDLFFSLTTNRFYVWNGLQYRVLEPLLINKGKSYVIGATDVDNAQHLIYYTKFKYEKSMLKK